MQSINNSSSNGRGTASPSENSRKSFHRDNIQSLLRSIARAFLFSAAAILTLLLSIVSSSFAGSATWKKIPATNDWQTAANWTPRTVLNGPLDTSTSFYETYEKNNSFSIRIL